MAENDSWEGEERRCGGDRRQREERRSSERVYWERRSGLDRRGHPFYAPRTPQES